MSICESGLELLARLGSKPSLEKLNTDFFPFSPWPQHVIEIYGEEGSGKTQLLMDTVCKCILPQRWKDCPIGGLGLSLVFIDTDCHFSMIRLVAMMEAQISSSISKSSNVHFLVDDLEQLLQDSLSRLFVVHCHSSSSLLLTLYSLETLLSSSLDMVFLMIDSISAFYWQDRCQQNPNQFENVMKQIVDILEKLLEVNRLVAMVTKQALFQGKLRVYHRENPCGVKMEGSAPQKSQQGNCKVEQILEHKEFMGKAWLNFVTHRVILMKHSTMLSAFWDKHLNDLSSNLKHFKIEESGICLVNL